MIFWRLEKVMGKGSPNKFMPLSEPHILWDKVENKLCHTSKTEYPEQVRVIK